MSRYTPSLLAHFPRDIANLIDGFLKVCPLSQTIMPQINITSDLFHDDISLWSNDLRVIAWFPAKTKLPNDGFQQVFYVILIRDNEACLHTMQLASAANTASLVLLGDIYPRPSFAKFLSGNRLNTLFLIRPAYRFIASSFMVRARNDSIRILFWNTKGNSKGFCSVLGCIRESDNPPYNLQIWQIRYSGISKAEQIWKVIRNRFQPANVFVEHIRQYEFETL